MEFTQKDVLEMYDHVVKITFQAENPDPPPFNIRKVNLILNNSFSISFGNQKSIKTQHFQRKNSIFLKNSKWR